MMSALTEVSERTKTLNELKCILYELTSTFVPQLKRVHILTNVAKVSLCDITGL